jgi:hypothetical protein
MRVNRRFNPQVQLQTCRCTRMPDPRPGEPADAALDTPASSEHPSGGSQTRHHEEPDDEQQHSHADRLPMSSRGELVWGALIAVLALVALDGGIASWAQWTARTTLAGSVADGQHSLNRHVLAMVLLSALTVAVGCLLALLRERMLALVVLAGVAAGPMGVLAAPVSASLVTVDVTDTYAWWHLVVQSGQFAILLAWGWWSVRRLPAVLPQALREGGHPPDPVAHGRISSTLLFALYAAVTLTAQILSRTSNGIESAGLLTMVGWAALGAGCAVVVTQVPARLTATWITAGGVLAIGAMYSAYYRPGGWPGVAGWENGIEAPVVLSFSTTACVLAGPLIGAVLHRRHAAAPSAGRDPAIP